MVDMNDIKAHFKMCGFERDTKTNRWHPTELNTAVPVSRAITYEQHIEYSKLRKLK